MDFKVGEKLVMKNGYDEFYEVVFIGYDLRALDERSCHVRAIGQEKDYWTTPLRLYRGELR